ncbi:phage antirepressor Ant [Listeria monocytogenes]|uniref:phage antirepressor KilAC domain-containing protein n=1 Tax=Listeria TaxID=1637 RepID=UPI00052EAD2A|nr:MULTISPECIES: phage antirepressor KilAC domain-containing protein [Listeria]QPQ95141.1 phage antirepressor KilAC domain-containing protein [Listeria welshimeri]EAC5355740.1 phage antirepressor Ant [Listeria monocytogenes]EAC9303064.1 phage antirepressor Ant [Listeria monocytogenes]EAC9583510.1 phage antirepressor Ant [Listeria monocytogenes]EAD0550763.1 phage antirepressor Ant [Listeria monocytogenes]
MSNLQVIANEMLPVLENEKGEKFVDARMLHEKLLVNTRFNDWISRMIGNYGYENGLDFYSTLSKTNGRPSTNYFLTLDTAKELAMVQNNEMGRAIRKYFIEVEKQARKLATEYPTFSYMIEDPVARAKKWIEEQQEKQEALKQLEEQKPKVVFAEAVQTSENTILVKDLATILKQKGLDIGQNRLFEWLRGSGYLLNKGAYYNKPSQKAMNLGLFEQKTHIHTDRNGLMITTYTPRVTGKGQVYLLNKLLEEHDQVIS